MIIDANKLSNLTLGYKATFNGAFRRAEGMMHWQQLATVVNSTTATETYSFLGQFPRMRELLGERVVKNLQQYNYTISNKTWESTVAIPRTAVEDDQYSVYGALFEELGFAAAEHPERLVFEKLLAGFSETGYDGQFFFDTDHPVGNGTVSNSGGGTNAEWFLMDTRRALRPLIYQMRAPVELVAKVNPNDDNVLFKEEYIYAARGRMNVGFGLWQYAYGSKQALSSTTFDAAMAAMMSVKTDEGRPLGVMPNLLIVGPSNRAAALGVLEAERLANGASNTNFRATDLIVTPYLT